MKKRLKIEKQFPLPLEVINVEDASATRLTHVAQIPCSVYFIFITFGGSCFTLTENRNRRGTMDKGGDRQMVARTSGPSNGEKANTFGPCVKQRPEEVVNIFYSKPADCTMFDEQNQESYEALKEAMKPYCSV